MNVLYFRIQDEVVDNQGSLIKYGTAYRIGLRGLYQLQLDLIISLIKLILGTLIRVLSHPAVCRVLMAMRTIMHSYRLAQIIRNMQYLMAQFDGNT